LLAETQTVVAGAVDQRARRRVGERLVEQKAKTADKSEGCPMKYFAAGATNSL
jgi:hypothetical protein